MAVMPSCYPAVKPKRLAGDLMVGLNNRDSFGRGAHGDAPVNAKSSTAGCGQRSKVAT
jgi:hypothetical protein